MQPWRRRFLLLYMMRVPLFFLGVLGLGLPWAFQTSMFHGVADLVLYQLAEAACLAFLLVCSAMTGCYLVLLYGEERADGWGDRRAPQDRISRPSVLLLYLYAGVCYTVFLVSICKFMSQAGRVGGHPSWSFLVYSSCGFLLGLLVAMLFFLGVLRFGKPDDDDALEVFAFPAFLLIRKLFGGAWIRSFKRGSRSRAVPGSYAAHDGAFSRFLASLLGPGYAAPPTPDRPSLLHSGFRSATIVLLVFLLAYWVSGELTLSQLRDIHHWRKGFAPNSVLNFILLVLIFWNSLLTALTFFVDRFRLPALAVFAAGLYLVAYLGSSDHFFYTLESQASTALPTPQKAFQNAPDAVIVVAAAGGGIQSAAWTSRVLCGLRSDPSLEGFQNRVLAISGVSGGSVGTLFYLRCLEGAKDDQRPAKWAQDSSLEAVAWGMAHPDLRRIFIPGPATQWSRADRGWALERSLLKSAHFDHIEHLADLHQNPAWPIVLLNSTDALTGDPVVFTNSNFPSSDAKGRKNHYLRNFHQSSEGQRDVLLETAARMSAAFPYVSPEARPDGVDQGVHLGDGGYFDNSGVFALSEWLKEAVIGGPKKRILILQLEAFPDNPPTDTENAKKWYYQLIAPIETMLTVRSEGQIVRDRAAGEDLQKLLNGGGHQTTWLLLRYLPAAAGNPESPCPRNPPLSWHLTLTEQNCIDEVWSKVESYISQEIAVFLKGSPDLRSGECVTPKSPVPGVFEQRCPASASPDPTPSGF